MSVKLNDEEQKLADKFVSGQFKKKSDLRDFNEIARHTKDARINLRLQDDVLKYFQILAEKEGVPYQTLINSILFKFAKGQLVETSVADMAKQLEEIKEKISEIEIKKQA